MNTLSAITMSLERAWTAIRTAYPDVRPAIITVYLHARGDRRGHFRQSCWTTINAQGARDEVHISSHILKEGPISVFQTLLHEAGHSICVTRNVQDVSRQGRYHNLNFGIVARTLGLVTASDPKIGVVTTGITDAARDMFSHVLVDLAETLDLYQDLRVQPQGRKPKGKSTSVKLQCPTCGRIIRASAKTVKGGPIECVPCNEDFHIVG